LPSYSNWNVRLAFAWLAIRHVVIWSVAVAVILVVAVAFASLAVSCPAPVPCTVNARSLVRTMAPLVALHPVVFAANQGFVTRLLAAGSSHFWTASTTRLAPSVPRTPVIGFIQIPSN